MILQENKIEHYRLKKMACVVKDFPRILDLGCSVHQNIYLHNECVIGLDLDYVLPAKNYKKIVVGDVLDLPKPFRKESFDAITGGEIIEHLESPLAFLRGCYDTLKPGGVLVLSTLNPNSVQERILTLFLSRRFYYDPEHVCLYPQRWLIRLFEMSGFENVKIISGGSTLPIIMNNIPFPRAWAQYTIIVGEKLKK